MKSFLLMAVLVMAGTAFAADEAKPTDAKPADTKPATGTPTTKTGKMSSPVGEDKSIVAVLHTEDPTAPKKGKKKKDAPASESINLVATGDVAKQVTDLTAKNALVEVSGSMADGKLTVTEVKELPAPEKKKKKTQ